MFINNKKKKFETLSLDIYENGQSDQRASRGALLILRFLAGPIKQREGRGVK